MLTNFLYYNLYACKILEKICFDYSSLLLYNHKSHNLQRIIHVIKIKNVKFSYKSYSIFIHMLGYQKTYH